MNGEETQRKSWERCKQTSERRRRIAQSSAPDDESGVYLETVGSESWVFEKLSGKGADGFHKAKLKAPTRDAAPEHKTKKGRKKKKLVVELNSNNKQKQT